MRFAKRLLQFLLIGSPAAAHQVSGDQVPPNLATYYLSTRVGAPIVLLGGRFTYFTNPAGSYYYEAFDNLNGWYTGTYDPSNGVREFSQLPVAFTNAGNEVFYGAAAPVILNIQDNHANYADPTKHTDLQFNNNSLPRGIVPGSLVISTVNTAALTTGTALQSGNFVLPTGRAYRWVHRTHIIGSVAGAQANMFMRCGTLSPTGGDIYGPVRSQAQLTASPGQYQQFAAEFLNTSGTDLTVSAAAVISNTSGTSTEIADATKPRYLYVEDIGSTINYAGLISAS